MTRTRLLLLISADQQALTGSLNRHLSQWCEAGLLGDVIWLSAHDLLAQAPQAAQGTDAACWYNNDGSWVSDRLGRAIAKQHREEVWLAALRHPEGPGGSLSREQARRKEEECYVVLERLMASGIEMRSLTLQVASDEMGVDKTDFWPTWDLHLVFDRDVEAHESSPRASALSGDPLSLCAMAALCVSGAWRGAGAALDIEPDRYDGNLKPARYIHCQTRVLHTHLVDRFALPAALPSLPPWPLPETADAERAQPDAVPPLAISDHLARDGGFTCRPMPQIAEPRRRSALVNLVQGLVRSVPEPQTNDAAQSALRRFADRTGGLEDDGSGVQRPKFQGTAELRDLVQHINRSDFLPPGNASEVFAPIPDSWRTVRETMFGLVDGGPLPSGLAHPTQGTGDAIKKLLWTDPSGVAPSDAPPDASDVLTAATRGLRNMNLSDQPEPVAQPFAEDPVEEPGDDAVVDEPDQSVTDSPNEAAATSPATESPAEDSVEESGTLIDSLPPKEAELEESVHEVTVHKDTLMERLGQRIAQELAVAQLGFVENCAVVSTDDEYLQAAFAQKWARRASIAVLFALIVVALFSVDQRWPFLAGVYEYVTPFDARRSYDPAIWPVGWLLIGAVLLATGATLLHFVFRRMTDKLHRLEQRIAERRRFESRVLHFATELLRLHGIALQYADHRLILTEFLHRPFGAVMDAESRELAVGDLRFESEPPHSMLVACANADPERVDALRQQDQEAAVAPCWLSETYERVHSIWSEHYAGRIVGDEFEGPDHDVTESHHVVHRDRREGTEVLGARTDFTRSVVYNPSSPGDGWAVREAAEAQIEGFNSEDVRKYLDLFGQVELVHGNLPAMSAEHFFDFGDREHQFPWGDVLAPGADPPQQKARSETEFVLLPDTSKARSLLMTWRIDVSPPIRPQDLDAWQSDGPSGPGDHSMSPPRSVV